MNEIDRYISNIDKPLERKSLEDLRAFLHSLLPTAEECISYGMPAFRVDGECVAGFAKFKNHLTFFPFSGSVIGDFATELRDFKYTKSWVHFTPEKPIPRELVEKIVQKRLHY